ncbi:hypothetical protein EMGBS15_16040 [Filimonas sp.]|nr:hypothetical protein EMGBS15_16040 [Filimonas sp.]
MPLDKKVFAALKPDVLSGCGQSTTPFDIHDIFENFGSEDWKKTFDDYTDDLYETPALLDSENLITFVIRTYRKIIERSGDQICLECDEKL